MFPAKAASHLKRFPVSFTGDSTGIDEIDIRFLIRSGDAVTGGEKELQHGLGVILIDLAAQSVVGIGTSGLCGQ